MLDTAIRFDEIRRISASSASRRHQLPQLRHASDSSQTLFPTVAAPLVALSNALSSPLRSGSLFPTALCRGFNNDTTYRGGKQRGPTVQAPWSVKGLAGDVIRPRSGPPAAEVDRPWRQTEGKPRQVVTPLIFSGSNNITL